MRMGKVAISKSLMDGEGGSTPSRLFAGRLLIGNGCGLEPFDMTMPSPSGVFLSGAGSNFVACLNVTD